MNSSYSRWDGSQDPFDADIETGKLLDELADDILSGTGPTSALRNLLRRGISGVTRGLDDLALRARRARREMASSLNLEGPLDNVRERLNEIVQEERTDLQGKEGEEYRMKEAALDLLPDGAGGALRELMSYEFESASAGEKFRELVAELQQQILDSYFQNLAGGIERVTPEQVAEWKQMIADLNEMIRLRNEGLPYDFNGFMQAHGHHFPENPGDLDQLLEILAARMAAMSRIMASLSPGQARQLQQLMDALLEDLDLAFQMDQLEQELRDLMPHLPWDVGVPAWGSEAGSLPETVGAVDALSQLEEVEQALRGEYAGASLDDIDESQLRNVLGDEGVRDLRRLKQIEKALEEAGVLTKTRGKLELTARGVRKLGERALVKVFEELGKHRTGAHDVKRAGSNGEPTGSTRPWTYGDSGPVSVQKSVFNSVIRTGGRRPLKMHPDDFEIDEQEERARTATALLLDLSFSMPLRGHWVPAKKMALALHSLIESKYPEDNLYLIGFSDYARQLEPSDLTVTQILERVYGTNMQHAFLLARRLLSQHPRATKQVIMVTDGEPTAHLVETEEGPYAVFSWPPTQETIYKTLAEATKLSNAGVTLNIFMLEEDTGLVDFMAKLAKRTSGRVFQAAGHDIGHFVLRDFVKRARR